VTRRSPLLFKLYFIMTLFFVLSQNSLEVYYQEYHFENLVFSLDSDKEVLQLHDKFTNIWQQLYDKYISKSSQIKLILKPKASFTDTRIVSIWCRSHTMFNTSVKFGVVNEQIESQIENFKNQIIYSQAPKIGRKS
jgi:hypothetical protein